MSHDEQGRDPLVRQRLGSEIRTLRKKLGLSAEVVAKEVGISTATLSKIETGKQAVKTAYIKLMAPLFELQSEQRENLLRMAEESAKPSPLNQYGDILRGDFVHYHEMERQATDLGVHETSTVFGPLQTPDYVRAMRLAAKPDSTEDDLIRSVDLRRDRFERLSAKKAPKVHVVLNEAVFVQHVGGRDVMRDQVAHLIEASRLPSIDLQVISGAAGAYAAQGCPFVLLHLPWEPALDVVFIESDMVASYLDAPAAVERYTEMFTQVRRLALNTQDTVSLLDRVRSNL